MNQPQCYRIGNINFIVTPVYSAKENETLFTLLLRLMEADWDKNRSVEASLT